MSFLDKALSDLTLSELQRLIRSEVARQVPPIPAGIANLSDSQHPLITPQVASTGMVLGYDASKDAWIPVVISETSDGVPPGVPLSVVVQPGIDFFAVGWTPVLNNDAVEYDVHVSSVGGFTPDGTNLAGTVSGTLLSVRNDPAGGGFVQGTTYYFVVIARDPDGSSAASIQVASELVQVNSDDIAANSITAGKIVAGAITADKLEAFLILGTTIATASAGARVQFDSTGIYLYDSNGLLSLSMDAQSGTLQLRGQVDFGRDPANPSRLTSSDQVDLYEQSTGFMDTHLVQVTTATKSSSGSSLTVTLPVKSTKHNLLYLRVALVAATGNSAQTISTPTGFTLLSSTLASGNELRMATFKREDAPATNSVTISIGSALTSHDRMVATLSEWTGVDTLDVKTTSTGSSTTYDTGTTGATGTTHELVLSDFLWMGHDDITYPTDENFALTIEPAILTPVPLAPIFVTSSFARSVTSTGAQDTQVTSSFAGPYIGHIACFKATVTSGTPNPPDTGKVRVYAKNETTFAELHVQDENAVESAVVLGAADQVWRMELVDKTIDPANLASLTAQDITVSIASLVAGDYCFFIGHDGAANSQMFKTRGPVCTTPGQITLGQWNTDSGAVNMASATFSFLVIHRS